MGTRWIRPVNAWKKDQPHIRFLLLRRGTWLALLFSFVVLHVLGDAPRSFAAEYHYEDAFVTEKLLADQSDDIDDITAIVRRIESRADLPVGIRFRQDVTVRVLFFTWRFHSNIHQTEEGLQAETVGAPKRLPDTIAYDLVDASRNPSMFHLEAVGDEDGLVMFQGPRIDYPGNGPTDAVLWVNTDDWVIEKAEIAYDWGKLFVSQEYKKVEGHTVLYKQSASVNPYGAQLEVVYSDYRF